MESIREQIAARILASGRSKTEIARTAGLHRVNLQQYLAGKRGLSLASLQKLAEILGSQITLSQ